MARMGVTAAVDPSTLLIPNEPATTFPLFSRLPPELRVKIFEQAAEEHQTIELERGIIRPAILSACYESRALLQHRYITHEGHLRNPFRVTFNPEFDHLYITALEGAFFTPSRMVRQITHTRNGNYGTMVRIPPMRRTNLQSMATTNFRACQLLISKIGRTIEGANFLATFQTLRMDVRAFENSILTEAALTSDTLYWASVWEYVIDDFQGVKKIEMRFSQGGINFYPLTCEQRVEESSKNLVQIGSWDWDGKTAIYECAVDIATVPTVLSEGELATMVVIFDGARAAIQRVQGEGDDDEDGSEDALPVLELPRVVFMRAEAKD